MMNREAVPLGQNIGDAAAVADAPIRLVAQQAAWAIHRDRRGLL
jgi:hypothetical protein